jgi:AhpD family alkylhydroperoxidase
MTHNGNTVQRHRGLVRAILLVLGVNQALIGVTMLADPRGWFESFPLGRDWVEALPPFNEHLVIDVGSLFLGIGVLAVLAAVWLERRLVIATCVAWLLYAVPHTIYHSIEQPLGTGDAIANLTALAATVLGPGLILLLARRPAALAGVPAGTGEPDGARLPPVEGGGPLVRYAYRASRKQTGKVIGPVKVMAHHRRILAGYGAMEQATMSSHRCPENLKALAELKAATMTGCDFCMDIGSAIARKSGMTERQMREFLIWRESDAFSPLEKLVIDYAVAMSGSPVDVSDELFAQLREHLDEAQIVELTSAIAWENYRGRFWWALRIRADGFSDGAYRVGPEGASSSATMNPGASTTSP